jgi:DNA mismatch endonuclease, patch repair protein
MADTLTADQRRACMRAVASKDTTPEMRIRRLVHSMGYRYALHTETLPGKPDLVFVSRRKIIFVHGCFWHSHNCHHGSVSPVTNSEYWVSKRERNAARDKANIRTLRRDGWKVLVVWECWTQQMQNLSKMLETFLNNSETRT